MTHRHPTARLFVAIDPPEQVRDALAAWARLAARAVGGGVGEGPSIARVPARGAALTMRVLDPALLHVTLCFLGNRPVHEIEALGEQLGVCAAPTGELSLGAPLWLPPRRPRALAVELHDCSGALARLQADLVAALEQASAWRTGERLGSRSPEPKPRLRFRPHITVARMARGARDRRSRRSASGELALPPTPALSFVPAELVLYRSWLSEQGAAYEALAACRIG